MIAALLALQLAAAPPPLSVRDRVDQGLLITSLSLSSVALGLTLSCTATGDCRELNPVMRRVLGEGPVRAASVKAVVNGVGTYGIWRLTHGRPKTRTLVLAGVALLNGWDAVHDVRQMRRLQARRE